MNLNRGENLVLIVAENVGRIPPNTAALAIDDGVAPSRTLVSNADLQTTAAYRVVVEIDGADDPGVIRASPWVALGGGAYRLSERLTSDATSMCLAIEASPLGLAPERLSAHDIERLYWTTGLAEVLIPNSPLFLSLQELVAVGRVVASLNHVIAQSTWFQDFAVRLGVHGTAAYLTGGASIAAAVPAEVRTQILGAFQDAPIAVATTLARLHIDAAVAAHARANALARDMEEGRTGASASSAIPIEVLDAAWADLAFAVSFSLPMAHFIVGIQPGTSIADQLRRIGVTFGLTTTGYMAPLASAVAEPLLMAHRYWELLAEMGEAGAQLRQDVAAKRTSFIPPPPGSPDSSGGMRALPPPCAVASGG